VALTLKPENTNMDDTTPPVEDGQVIDNSDQTEPPVEGSPDTPAPPVPAASVGAYPTPIDADALSPTNATGYPTAPGAAPGVASTYTPKPMTSAKAVLLGKLENMLHGVPVDIEHDEVAIMSWLRDEYNRVHVKTLV
jgi:hypothetical protein